MNFYNHEERQFAIQARKNLLLGWTFSAQGYFKEMFSLI